MGVHSFLEATQFLYDNNFYDEAFCLVCVALDASAQIQYPNLKLVNDIKNLFLPTLEKFAVKDFLAYRQTLLK